MWTLVHQATKWYLYSLIAESADKRWQQECSVVLLTVWFAVCHHSEEVWDARGLSLSWTIEEKCGYWFSIDTSKWGRPTLIWIRSFGIESNPRGQTIKIDTLNQTLFLFRAKRHSNRTIEKQIIAWVIGEVPIEINRIRKSKWRVLQIERDLIITAYCERTKNAATTVGQ